MFTQLINTFSTGTYTVNRSVVSTYDSGGILVPGSVSAVNVSGYIEPLSGSDLSMVPEGYHVSDLRRMYSKEALLPKLDSVTYQGEEWVVINVEEWQGFGLAQADNYYMSTIARQPTP